MNDEETPKKWAVLEALEIDTNAETPPKGFTLAREIAPVRSYRQEVPRSREMYRKKLDRLEWRHEKIMKVLREVQKGLHGSAAERRDARLELDALLERLEKKT